MYQIVSKLKEPGFDYIFFVRHGSRKKDWHQEERFHGLDGYPGDDQLLQKAKEWESPPPERKKSIPGYIHTIKMAGYFCDWLDSEHPESSDFKIVRIYHSGHEVARQTAECFSKVLLNRKIDVVSLEKADWLDPDKSVQVPEDKVEISTEHRNAIILIGHQPFLTFLSQELVAQLPADVLPLGNSEVGCMVREEDKYRLDWLMTSKEPNVLEDLKAKINSKFEVAKFFLGAFIVNNAILLNQNVWENVDQIHEIILGLGIVSALFSLFFTVYTLFSYDNLLMPETFWGGEQKSHGKPPPWSVKRPPSQAHLILFYEMINIWQRFFIPAIVAALFSVACFVLVILDSKTLYFKCCLTNDWWWLSVVFLGVFLSSWGIYKKYRPKLGFED